MYVNRKYIYTSYINTKRFKIFELRDRLAVMAMKGDIDDNSPEYKFMLKSLNSFILATERFEVIDFMKYILRLKRSPEIIGEYVQIEDKILGHSDELKDIYRNFCGAAYEISVREIRPFLIAMFIFGTVLSWINISIQFANKILRVANEVQSYMKNAKERSEAVA